MNKYIYKQTFLGVALASMITTTAFAQNLRLEQPPTTPAPSGDAIHSDSEVTFMVSEFMGLVVKDEANHDLGTVKDLVLNSHGEVLYLAVQPQEQRSEQGLVFLPFAALNLDAHQDHKITHVTTVITHDRFIQAPVYTHQHFHANGGPNPMYNKINTFFGVRGPRVGFGFNERGRGGDFGNRDGRNRVRDGERDIRDGVNQRDPNRNENDLNVDGQPGRVMKKNQGDNPVNNKEVAPKAGVKADAEVNTPGVKPTVPSVKPQVKPDVKVNTPKVETPNVKTPKVEVPKVKTPKIDTP